MHVTVYPIVLQQKQLHVDWCLYIDINPNSEYMPLQVSQLCIRFRDNSCNNAIMTADKYEKLHSIYMCVSAMVLRLQWDE